MGVEYLESNLDDPVKMNRVNLRNLEKFSLLCQRL